MIRSVLFSLLLVKAFGEDFRTIVLDEGTVIAEKFWNGDFYEFYGIPYASVPKGKDRFQGPLPPKPWKEPLEATVKSVICPQTFYTEDPNADKTPLGEEECLRMNLLVPKMADEQNLVPVLVYIHSGAFAAGEGNMARFHFLAKHDVLVVSFNYRLGAIGFACLGTKEIPGNAGMKDQVAALRWIKKNIKKFGGDPDNVTLAGFSVGATMAELLLLSKSTEGLIHKLILESGSALAPYAINRNPIHTAASIAKSVGYNSTGKTKDLTDFYIKTSATDLALNSINFFLPNGTFGFAPCIENIYDGIEPFLTESPLHIMKKGAYNKVPVITGFANMEGISRLSMFEEWSDMMNENFADFLPADLKFENGEEKDAVIQKIQEKYFKGEEITHDNVQSYVDYHSDSLFKYSILRSAKLHSLAVPVYFYEFSYYGTLNLKHHFMDRIKGASHRDQTSYILDFYGFTNNHDDLDVRDRLTTMWTDFAKYGNPTKYENILIKYKWSKYSKKNPKYLNINVEVEEMENIFDEDYKFWNDIYEKYYWEPTPQ